MNPSHLLLTSASLVVAFAFGIPPLPANAQTTPTCTLLDATKPVITYRAKQGGPQFTPPNACAKQGSTVTFRNESGGQFLTQFDTTDKDKGQSVPVGRAEYKRAFPQALSKLTYCDKATFFDYKLSYPYHKRGFDYPCTSLNVPKGTLTVLSPPDYDKKNLCSQGSIPEKWCKNDSECGAGYTTCLKPPNGPQGLCTKRDYYDFCNIPRPKPPTLEFHILTPTPKSVVESGKTLDITDIEPGTSVRLSWTTKDATSCNLPTRAVLKNNVWVEQKPELATANNVFGSEGRYDINTKIHKDEYTVDQGYLRTGSLVLYPRESVQYGLQCFGQGGSSEVKTVRVLFKEVPPTFSNLKNITGVRAQDLVQTFTFDVTGTGTMQLPTLDPVCKSLGVVNAYDASHYQVLITPKSTALNCTITTRRIYTGRDSSKPAGPPVTLPFSILAYPVPNLTFGLLRANMGAPSGDSTGNARIVQNDKAKLLWAVLLDQPGVTVTLTGGPEDKRWENRDRTTLNGSMEVNPKQTTTYTMTVTNRYGITKSVSRTVTVTPKLAADRVISESQFPRVQDPLCLSDIAKWKPPPIDGGQVAIATAVGAAAGFGACALFPASVAAAVSWIPGVNIGAAAIAGVWVFAGCTVVGVAAGAAVAVSPTVLATRPTCPFDKIVIPPGNRATTAAPTLDPDNLGGLTPDMSGSIHVPLTLSEKVVLQNRDVYGNLTRFRTEVGVNSIASHSSPIFLIRPSSWNEVDQSYEVKPVDKLCPQEDDLPGGLNNPIKRNNPVANNFCLVPQITPYYHQWAPQWSTRTYDRKSFESIGCGPTSIAMSIDYWKRIIKGPDTYAKRHITPSDVATILYNNDLFDSQGTKSREIPEKASKIFPGFTMEIIYDPWDSYAMIAADALFDFKRDAAIKKMKTLLSMNPKHPILLGVLGNDRVKRSSQPTQPAYQQGETDLFLDCSPDSSLTAGSHFLVVTGTYEENGETIFTLSDPGGMSQYCFNRNVNGRNVIQRWYGEAPASEIKKFIQDAYDLHPVGK